MKKQKKNIFITGGFGQDGKILTNLLDSKKYKIFIFSKQIHKNTNKKYIIIKENLKVKKNLRTIFKKNKPDIVLHMASNNPAFNEKSYHKFYKENFLITKNIFDETFKVNLNSKFIFFNSSQIFRDKKRKVNEYSKFIGDTDYTKFRIDSHNYMLNKKVEKKLNYTNLILFNHDSKFRNRKFIIPRIIIALKENNFNFLRKIIKQNIYADFSHAEDICRAIIKLISSKKNIDNIILSSNKSTSLNQIINFLIKKYRLKTKVKINNIEKQKCLIGNNSFAKKVLRWRPNKNIFIAAEELYKTL
ncbi:NAD-dependent epimerase/dehydratase family protein [Candidatus Pelagibacter sp.]|uniref:NAD-dependent epimerase/dehydratase family protein n=1 Tax=Candidatus Pelagibacter sp. TaxID=2024849 RepID=UPI003F841897